MISFTNPSHLKTHRRVRIRKIISDPATVEKAKFRSDYFETSKEIENKNLWEDILGNDCDFALDSTFQSNCPSESFWRPSQSPTDLKWWFVQGQRAEHWSHFRSHTFHNVSIGSFNWKRVHLIASCLYAPQTSLLWSNHTLPLCAHKGFSAPLQTSFTKAHRDDLISAYLSVSVCLPVSPVISIRFYMR